MNNIRIVRPPKKNNQIPNSTRPIFARLRCADLADKLHLTSKEQKHLEEIFQIYQLHGRWVAGENVRDIRASRIRELREKLPDKSVDRIIDKIEAMY